MFVVLVSCFAQPVVWPHPREMIFSNQVIDVSGATIQSTLESNPILTSAIHRYSEVLFGHHLKDTERWAPSIN